MTEILACPRCGRVLARAGKNYRCVSCGTVGGETLGFPDFTSGSVVALANGGTFDLRDDERAAQTLLCLGPDAAFEELVQVGSVGVEAGRGGQARFERRYYRVEAEAGDRHGTAILDKINAWLEHDAQPPIGGSLALEAGGGHGRYVYGFRSVFHEVVFVDCSLVNLVLAQRLAAEKGLDGVYFVRADVRAMPFPDGLFDFVHENGVIEHVDDPAAMVREAVRVLKPHGVYACISPNRFPVTPEPHFLLPLFGLFPRSLRRRLIARTRGQTDEAGTDLRSLRQLRAYGDAVFGSGFDAIYFLPPSLPSIARRTPLRRAVQVMLRWRWLRHLLLSLVNGPLLGIMPYHIAVGRRRVAVLAGGGPGDLED